MEKPAVHSTSLLWIKKKNFGKWWPETLRRYFQQSWINHIFFIAKLWWEGMQKSFDIGQIPWKLEGKSFWILKAKLTANRGRGLSTKCSLIKIRRPPKLDKKSEIYIEEGVPSSISDSENRKVHENNSASRPFSISQVYEDSRNNDDQLTEPLNEEVNRLKEIIN